MKKLSQIFIILCLKLSFSQVEAVVIDAEGWARGDFVEIGVSNIGSFGANTSNKPNSFHDNREMNFNNLFGFIANPQKDGWLDYDGDYFAPGNAEEGFTIEIDGINYSNNSLNKKESYDIIGEVTSASTITSSCFDISSQLIWEGSVNNLQIKRFFNLTKDGLFIKMTTFLYNDSDELKRNVFFMHNVDPDNNQAIGHPYEFRTDILLFSQGDLPENISLIKASQPPEPFIGDTDGSHISFYANDRRSRVAYGGFSNRSASDVWNGISLNSSVGDRSESIDQSISIAFNLGDIGPYDNIEFTYYYILEDVNTSFDPPIIGNISRIDQGLCGPGSGEILVAGLKPNETYTISYNYDNIIVPAVNYSTNEFGNFVIPSLSDGVYSNFIIEQNNCSTTINDTIEIFRENPNGSIDAKVVISKQFSPNQTARIVISEPNNYRYRLNDGAYQTSSLFKNIPFGLNRFYIIDFEGCNETLIEKISAGYSPYFTPNGDGINDNWYIRNIESIIINKIFIFNRYGKLLKQLGKNNDSWDGTFNNVPMPTAGYWFTVHYIDNDENIEKSFNGYFTLKR